MKDEVLDEKSRYYDVGGIETLDIIRAKLTPEQYKGFLLGNILKYGCRANHKGCFERDLEKVGYYQAFLAEFMSIEARAQELQLPDVASRKKSPILYGDMLDYDNPIDPED